MDFVTFSQKSCSSSFISSSSRIPFPGANQCPWVTNFTPPSTFSAAKPTTPPVPVASEPDVADDWEMVDVEQQYLNYHDPSSTSDGPFASCDCAYPFPASEGSGYHNPFHCQRAVDTFFPFPVSQKQ